MNDRLAAGARLSLALIVLISLAAGSLHVAAWQTRPDAATLSATEEILNKVSQLRQLEVKQPVRSGLKSKDEIEQFVIKDLDETTTPEEFAATQKTLVRLGLIPQDFQLRQYVISLLREQVAGFYEPKTQEFYLAAWVPLAEQKTVIAHELMHALQDQHFDLRRFENWPKGDSDAELAAHALVEGEATILMYMYAFDQQGARLDVTKIGSLTDRMLAEGDATDASKYPVLARAPTVLREGLQFPYVYGSGFVQAIMKSGSWLALNQSYRRLPSSTEQIMHPERFLNRDDPVTIELADLKPVLGDAWRPGEVDINGEFGYRILLAEFIDKGRASRAAAGWGGDRYVLFEERKTGATLLGQYTVWDSITDAREFFDAYAERTEKRYNVGRAVESTSELRVYETSQGLAWIELRGGDVVNVEGAADRNQARRLAEALWRSTKARRQ
jgi:hypothetical protein